jgi:hypothetical protein
VCPSIWKDGGDDEDAMFEYGEIVAWSCGAKAWVYVPMWGLCSSWVLLDGCMRS